MFAFFYDFKIVFKCTVLKKGSFRTSSFEQFFDRKFDLNGLKYILYMFDLKNVKKQKFFFSDYQIKFECLQKKGENY